MLFASLLGRFTTDALPHDPVQAFGALTIVGAGLSAFILITVMKRWKWLWKEWLTTVDPKRIGVMYLIISLLMLLRGGADALMMRVQQATSANGSGTLLDAGHYQQVFSAHGTIMIFFVAMGLLFGIINLVIPLMIGARDVAFPLLNAISFWLFFAGMVVINLSLVVGEFSAAGWLAYPPLSGIQFSPGTGVDYWIWSLQISGIGSLLSAVNFMVTILTMRAVGMKLMKMPMFVWSVLGSMAMIAFAFPILTVTLTLLALDRTLGMHFFTADGGGNAMMYVNLIWAWGHPEVYILILPAFGIFSEIVATFSRKRLFGYASMVWATASIVVLSFIVWLHHFFTMGAGANVNAFFGIMTMVIAIPTGVKLFNWLFTMYRGRIKFATPMLWFMGFVVTFTIGGMAGVLMAIPPVDFQMHNSLFLVAHFHMMIIGGVVFGFFAGLTYWFPKIFGFKLNERLGTYAFWCWISGFMLAFLPLYVLGFMGATRRLDSYDASLGWQPLFIVAGIGVLVIALGVAFQVLQLVVSIWKRHEYRDTTGDPWNGRTLEWSTTSPAPSYNFAVQPVVSTRDAFWESKHSRKAPTELEYEPITMPRNTPVGLIIGLLSFVCAFSIIWYVWWLAAAALVGIIVTIIVRSLNDNTEYTLSAAKVAKLEQARLKEVA
jgi:cytochrome o ubiquinol oxidase subunit I